MKRRTLWRNTRRKCVCGGYHFPHRKGGGACEHGLRRDYYLAIRQGLSKPDALALLSVNGLESLP